MDGILGDIIEILTSGLTTYGQAFGTAVSNIVKSMFIVSGTSGSPDTLSVFGSLVCVFAGLALCIGLTRRLFGFVSSLGTRN